MTFFKKNLPKIRYFSAYLSTRNLIRRFSQLRKFILQINYKNVKFLNHSPVSAIKFIRNKNFPCCSEISQWLRNFLFSIVYLQYKLSWL